MAWREASADMADTSIEWADMKQYDDDHDNEWFIQEEKRMGELYGQFIRVKYSSQGRVGYFCELCTAECNGKKSLEAHCSGMKHLKKKNLWEKGEMAEEDTFPTDSVRAEEENKSAPKKNFKKEKMLPPKNSSGNTSDIPYSQRKGLPNMPPLPRGNSPPLNRHPNEENEGYSNGRADRYLPMRDDRFPPGRDENYPPGREGNYPPGREGNYPPGREGNYPPGRERNYPPGRERNYPPGREGNYPTGRDDRYPPIRDDKYSHERDDRFLHEREDRYLCQWDDRYLRERDERFFHERDERFLRERDERFFHKRDIPDRERHWEDRYPMGRERDLVDWQHKTAEKSEVFGRDDGLARERRDRYNNSPLRKRYGRSDSQSPPRKRPVSPKEQLAKGPTGALLQKLSECAVKSEDDSYLAVSVITALTKSLKDYYGKKENEKAFELLMELELKICTVKAFIQATKLPIGLASKPTAPAPPSIAPAPPSIAPARPSIDPALSSIAPAPPSFFNVPTEAPQTTTLDISSFQRGGMFPVGNNMTHPWAPPNSHIGPSQQFHG